MTCTEKWICSLLIKLFPNAHAHLNGIFLLLLTIQQFWNFSGYDWMKSDYFEQNNHNSINLNTSNIVANSTFQTCNKIFLDYQNLLWSKNKIACNTAVNTTVICSKQAVQKFHQISRTKNKNINCTSLQKKCTFLFRLNVISVQNTIKFHIHCSLNRCILLLFTSIFDYLD